MLPDVNQIRTYMVEFNYELHKYDNSVFNCSKLQNCVQHQLVRNYFIIYTANCPYSVRRISNVKTASCKYFQRDQFSKNARQKIILWTFNESQELYILATY